MWLACSQRWLQRPASASRFSRPDTESLDCTTVFGGARPNGGLSVPDHDNNDKLVRSRVNLIEPMIKSTTVETLPRSSLPFDTSFLFFFNRYRELDRSLDLSKIFRCWNCFLKINVFFQLIYWDVQCQIFLPGEGDIKNALSLLIILVDGVCMSVRKVRKVR